jgi:hypothetical protein
VSKTAGQRFKCASGECILDYETDSDNSADNYMFDMLMHDHDNDDVGCAIRNSIVKHKTH